MSIMALKSVTLLIMVGNWDSAHEGLPGALSQQLVHRGYRVPARITREREKSNP